MSKPYTSLQPSPTRHVLVLETEGVLRVSFNRAPVNAFDDAQWLEMSRIFMHIRDDPEVLAVVLSGEGRCFTAGLDLMNDSLSKTLEQSDDVARRAYYMRKHIRDFQAAITSIEECEKPVISAVHGVSFGLGVDLMSACDVRYSSSNARFCIKEVDIALAADIGSLQRMPKVVANGSWVRELALTAREFDANEAFKFGFVSKVVEGGKKEVEAAAIETAKLIASKSPVAVRGTKIALNHARDHTVQEGLDFIAAWNMSMLQTSDLPVAMAAAMQKQKAVFAKL